MIPFSLMQVLLFAKTGEMVEVRVLELSPDSFTLRLAHRRKSLLERLDRVMVRFYHPDRDEVVECDLIAYAVETLPEDEWGRYYARFRFDVADSWFSKEASLLSKEYLNYIEARLTLTDQELSEEYLPGYPKETGFGVKKPVFPKVLYPLLKEVSWGLLLSGRKTAAKGAFDWLAYGSLRESGADLPRPDFLYLGDSFCPLRFPDIAQVRELLPYVKESQTRLVFLLAPVPESLLESVCARLLALDQLLSEYGIKGEIEVGDVGMLAYCQENCRQLLVSAGILMHKKTKDPRKAYYDGPSVQGLLSHSDETASIQGLLSCLDETANALYLPYYQTNTGTFCPLQALLQEGNRGASTRQTTCDHSCEHRIVSYDRSLSMVGMGNSLFGIASETMTIDGFQKMVDYVNQSDNPQKRIVLNL